eukprot:TRINITY_DN65435_c0_g1_i1.p1 TRINITY_DN65435_c0_g1~~TRINITY_DN65435_c0_g1_i1.p1  ORF type:complete len:249 (+),score=36.06 TRINITY_DN65435_c0_g1_i1:78-749(+)
MALRVLCLLSFQPVVDAHAHYWFADWKPDKGCTPPAVGKMIMGNPAELDNSLNWQVFDSADSTAAAGLFVPGASYTVTLTSSEPSESILHVSSGSLSLPASSEGAEVFCDGSAIAWSKSLAEKTITWTAPLQSAPAEVHLTHSSAPDYMIVGISKMAVQSNSISSISTSPRFRSSDRDRRAVSNVTSTTTTKAAGNTSSAKPLMPGSVGLASSMIVALAISIL